jgi:hypothetical protein
MTTQDNKIHCDNQHQHTHLTPNHQHNDIATINTSIPIPYQIISKTVMNTNVSMINDVDWRIALD